MRTIDLDEIINLPDGSLTREEVQELVDLLLPWARIAHRATHGWAWVEEYGTDACFLCTYEDTPYYEEG